MPILDGKSAALLTKNEAILVRETAPAKLRAVPPARLLTKVARIRQARDKYDGLARRQRGEAKGTVAPRGQRRAEGDVNTTKKVEIFAAALSRVEAELTRRDGASAKKSAAKKGAAKKAPAKMGSAKRSAAAKKTGAARGGARKSVAAKRGASARSNGATKVAAKATRAKTKSNGKKPSSFGAQSDEALSKLTTMQLAKSGARRTGHHMAARNRRNQARSDARH